MNPFDQLLIDKVFSPACGRLEHGLGVGRWRAALESLLGSMVVYVAAVAMELAMASPDQPVFVILLRALAWLLILDRARRLCCRQAGSSIGVQSARLREWPFRTALAAMVPLSLTYVSTWANAFYSLSLLLLVTHLYLKACESPPPEPRGRLAFDLT